MNTTKIFKLANHGQIALSWPLLTGTTTLILALLIFLPSTSLAQDSENYEPMRRRMQQRMQNRQQSAGKPMQGRIGRMRAFLGFMEKYLGNVQDPRRAAGIALFSIKENYVRNNQKEKAIEEFTALLAKTKDPKMRNIIMFTLRQVYNQQKDRKKSMAIDRQILNENLATIEAE